MTLTDLERFHQAIALAETGKKTEAHAILAQLRRSNPQNSRVLLCFAFTASDPLIATEALDCAKTLDPNNNSITLAKDWWVRQTEKSQKAVATEPNSPPASDYSMVFLPPLPSSGVGSNPMLGIAPLELETVIPGPASHYRNGAGPALPVKSASEKIAPGDSLWSNRNFWLLLFGQAISVLGDQCWFVALPWLVLELSGSSLDAGFTRALEYLPYILFGLIAGWLVDRRNRRRLLITIEVGRAVCLLAFPLLAWAGILQTWQVFLLAFILSSLDVFFNVGLAAVVPAVVAKEHLTQANSAMESVFSLTAIIGLPIMGALVALVGAPIVLGLDGLSFIFSLIVLLILRFPSPPKKITAFSWKQLQEDMLAGLSFIWRDKVMRSISILNFIGNMTNSCLLILAIFYVKEVLNLPGQVIGILLGAAAFGTFLGAINNSRLVKSTGHGNAVLFGLVLGVLPFLFYTLTDNWLLLGLGHFFFGLALIHININTNVIRQTVVAPDMLGRVIGSARMLAYTSIPLGAVGAGWLAEVWGVLPVFGIALGLRLLIIALAFFSPLRGYRLGVR